MFWKVIALSEALSYLVLWAATVVLILTSEPQKKRGISRILGGWTIIGAGVASILLPIVAVIAALYQLVF